MSAPALGTRKTRASLRRTMVSGNLPSNSTNKYKIHVTRDNSTTVELYYSAVLYSKYNLNQIIDMTDWS